MKRIWLWALCLTCAATGADAAPPYRIEQRDRVWWLVAPDGKRFFSRGVCCVGMGPSRQEYKADKPEYAAWRQYPAPAAWADATLGRMRDWGFTTVGGWSDYATLRLSRRANLSFTPVLHVGSTAGAPWYDMWDPKVIRRMEEVARKQILPLRDDPRLLGYYSDNEMGWWNAALFKMALEQPPTSGQRKRLIRLLRNRYRGNWAALRRDFVPKGAASFAGLERRGVLYLRPGGRGIVVVRRFLSMAASRYYQLVHQIIRKYDRRALVLGDRYQSFYYPEVARAAAPWVDAVSTNLNAHWNDGTFARYHLDTLHGLTGKPIMIGEFYMSAVENRSGNRNDSSGFPVVQTQAERAAGIRTSVNAILRYPFVIGADWFQYYDEPTFGRGDGENYNFGLVDIEDRPYQEVTRAFEALAPAAGRRKVAAPRPNASGGVPAAPGTPLADMKPLLALKSWDRERSFVRPTSRYPVADLYLCWAPDGIYLGLYAMNAAEDTFYSNKQIPEVDRMEWRVQIPGRAAPVRARLGAGRPPRVVGEEATAVSVPAAVGDTRTVAIMKLPAALFGRSRLAVGARIRLKSTLLTHARADRVTWDGSFRLAR